MTEERNEELADIRPEPAADGQPEPDMVPNRQEDLEAAFAPQQRTPNTELPSEKMPESPASMEEGFKPVAPAAVPEQEEAEALSAEAATGDEDLDAIKQELSNCLGPTQAAQGPEEAVVLPEADVPEEADERFDTAILEGAARQQISEAEMSELAQWAGEAAPAGKDEDNIGPEPQPDAQQPAEETQPEEEPAAVPEEAEPAVEAQQAGPEPAEAPEEPEEELPQEEPTAEPPAEEQPGDEGPAEAPAESGDAEGGDDEEGEDGNKLTGCLLGILGFFGRLTLWLLFAVLCTVAIIGGVIWFQYENVDPATAIPDPGVQFNGEALSPTSYSWDVPVIGPVTRNFRYDSGRTAELGTVTTTALEITQESQAYDTEVQLYSEAGDELYNGAASGFGSYTFEENGTYRVTVTTTPHNDEVIKARGSASYDFTFYLSAEPTLTSTRSSTPQGSAFALILKGALGDETPRLNCSFAPEATFVQMGKQWVAAVDVPLSTPGGTYEVRVTSGDYTLSVPMKVTGRVIRDLDVSTVDGTVLAPYIGAMDEALEPYMQVSDPQIYYQNGFVQPVRATVARDFYVNEYRDRITDATLIELVPDLVEAYNANIEPLLSVNVTFKTTPNTQVLCPSDARVIFVSRSLNGGTIVLEHGGGLKSIFYEMGTLGVAEGDFIYKGESIGRTGEYLICETRLNGTAICPWDIWRNLSGLNNLQ